MNAAHSLHEVPLASLQVSSTIAQRERRAQLDEASIAELAESIATVGLLQPLVVRRLLIEGRPGHEAPYEIVAGERRYLAARQAGLESVPVTVRDLTDEQVLEVQLVENLQRADVHPMAEAEGYEGLHKLGRTVDEIADKVGKSKAYVYARMKLLDLGQAGRKAFYAGKLTASTALYVARVPIAGGLQDEAVKEITATDWSGQPMSARRALEHVQEHYMLRLADAPFKTSDASLVAAAGACGDCPKRTGNQRELFADVKGVDVCTDPTCYRAKVTAHAERVTAKARECGQKVIEGATAKKIMPHGVHSLVGYVALDGTDYTGTKARTYRQILGKAFVPDLIVSPKDGSVIEVAPTSALPKEKQRTSGDDSYQAKQKAEQRKRDLDLAYRAELFRRVRTSTIDQKRNPKLNDGEVRAVAAWVLDNLGHDEQARLAKVLGWPTPKSKTHSGREIELPKPLDEHSDAEIAQLIRDMMLARVLVTYTWASSKPEKLEAAAEDFGIDAKAIRAELVAAQKAKTKAGASKKAKATPKAKEKTK